MIDRNLHNSSTIIPTIYYLSGSQYTLIQHHIRPGYYFARIVLNGLYQGSVELTMKGVLKMIEVTLSSHPIIGKRCISPVICRRKM